MRVKQKRSSGSVASLLLLEDLIKGVSLPSAGRLVLLAAVLLHRAPPGRELEARPPGAARRAGRGGGREDERAVSSVGCDEEGAGGAVGGVDGGRAAPQLPEAGALLQTAYSSDPGGLTLQGVGPGRQEEGLGAVQAS